MIANTRSLSQCLAGPQFRRRPGEAIVIPGLDVKITIIKVSPTRVELLVQAPRQHSILREELIDG